MLGFKKSSLDKIAEGNANWDYYLNKKENLSESYVIAMAKENSDANDNIFGDVQYFRKIVKEHPSKYCLTELGKSLSKIFVENPYL